MREIIPPFVLYTAAALGLLTELACSTFQTHDPHSPLPQRAHTCASDGITLARARLGFVEVFFLSSRQFSSYGTATQFVMVLVQFDGP